jgi:hypothetical protein
VFSAIQVKNLQEYLLKQPRRRYILIDYYPIYIRDYQTPPPPPPPLPPPLSIYQRPTRKGYLTREVSTTTERIFYKIAIEIMDEATLASSINRRKR